MHTTKDYKKGGKERRKKGDEVTVNFQPLEVKISRITFFKSNNPVLKYGEGMDVEAVNTFTEYIKKYYQSALFQNMGWFSIKLCHISREGQNVSCHLW